MTFQPQPPSPGSSSTSSRDRYTFNIDEKQSRQGNVSKHPYMSEYRERQGSASDESTGPYDHLAHRPRKSFLKRLTSCFEFDDSDPVARYRPRHEAIFGKNPVYRNHQIQPQNDTQSKMIPSETQAPNSFAGGMTGGSGTGGGAC